MNHVLKYQNLFFNFGHIVVALVGGLEFASLKNKTTTRQKDFVIEREKNNGILQQEP